MVKEDREFFLLLGALTTLSVHRPDHNGAGAHVEAYPQVQQGRDKHCGFARQHQRHLNEHQEPVLGPASQVRVEHSVTGGTAKSIQSKNVAVFVAVAAAAAFAGLASPAATHYLKKLRVAQNSSFSCSISVFFLQPPSFSTMSMPALNSFSGKDGPMKKNILLNKRHDFLGAIFCESVGHLLNIFFAFLCIYYQVLGSTPLQSR